MAEFDPVSRMRAGDASAWPRYQPEHLPSEEVHRTWVDALRRRGEPGVPSVIRLYTHFSYCESTCSFCMYFHQVPRDELAYARYVDHLVGSIERFESGAGRARVSSAYVGGGTPSATPSGELRRYLAAFRAAFEIEGEFSFEAHPRSMDLEKLELVQAYGVNRISMGIQSLAPEVLREITRKNAPLVAIGELVARARALGILVNLDLVLGLPEQTLASFRADVARLMEIGPDVLTLYRYQAVPQLSHQTPVHMHYHEAFDDETSALFEKCGYRIGDPVDGSSITVRLVRQGAPPQRWSHEQTYALFDGQPSHLIGFGPGAYGHAFGYGWFRDVTALDRLDQPAYWGTRISALDECRQILLDALENDRVWDTQRLREATGVDFETQFAEPFAWARAAGGLVGRGSCVKFGPLPADVRERITEALLPEAPTHGAAEPPPSFQRELVELRRAQRQEAGGDGEIVRAWCEALGVPERGRRLFGAIVRDLDDYSVYFAVRGSDGVPLRVHVRRPGTGRSFFETSRFAISYATRPGQPLSEAERAFLDQLSRAMLAAETS